ncbi:hypothetical protein [Brucella pseudintermedia]|uniref:hypothetical protein n=1 Tax=Brucella pseudintermedia TaxID=370111 RepID=UPI00124CAA43|nr:hypothetical protein [Brucella pseudintermedia]KAB2680354.1 hypothetical protein F9K78_16840 [Brucella pseudintermedia]
MDEFKIRSEMHQIVAENLANGIVVDVDMLCLGLMEKRGTIEGEGAEFYRVHTFKDVKRIAKSVIGKYDAKDTTDAELLLPGFKHLCKAYPMKRQGKSVLVPVDQCSDFELINRATQLEDMASGCRSHAGEIREYVLARTASAA